MEKEKRANDESTLSSLKFHRREQEVKLFRLHYRIRPNVRETDFREEDLPDAPKEKLGVYPGRATKCPLVTTRIEYP
jgi:hypothetical protein